LWVEGLQRWCCWVRVVVMEIALLLVALLVGEWPALVVVVKGERQVLPAGGSVGMG
jgi:hypothetical protein